MRFRVSARPFREFPKASRVGADAHSPRNNHHEATGVGTGQLRHCFQQVGIWRAIPVRMLIDVVPTPPQRRGESLNRQIVFCHVVGQVARQGYGVVTRWPVWLGGRHPHTIPGIRSNGPVVGLACPYIRTAGLSA